MKKKIDLYISQLTWLRFEQEIPFELEESFYWFLSNSEINRFSFEHNPDNNYSQSLFIWLPLNEWSVADQKTLEESFISLAKTFQFNLSPGKWTQLRDEDWNSIWKKKWEPDPIGNSILILPAWLDVPEQFSERKIVRLDPGIAFGTGSHPSTRLCIEALDHYSPAGKTIADLGCGSGILSLVALKLGAKCIFSVDIDSLAIAATKINFSLNNFPESFLNVYLGSIEELEDNLSNKKIDLLLCNILAPVIKSLASGFEAIVGDKGKVILSGLLFEQTTEIQEFFSILGWKVLEIKTKDQWASMVLTRK